MPNSDHGSLLKSAKVVPLLEHGKQPPATRTAGASKNRLLAALKPGDFELFEPHLELVRLRPAQVFYEAGDTIEHAYFPHDCMISLVAVLEEGQTAEMAVFGCEGVTGF